MARCKICILPETFPGISFNRDGVCSLCSGIDESPSISSSRSMKDELCRLFESTKSTSTRYDALVAFSGGKDSTFLMHWLKDTFRLRLLAFTFDNGFLSDASFSNMCKVVSALAIDHLIFKYRRDQLNTIFIESASPQIYPDHLTKFGSGVCISCIRMVMTAALRTAIEKQIPMVMLGNSPGQLLRSKNETIYQDNKIPFELRRALFSKLAQKLGSWSYDYLMLTKTEYNFRPFPYIISPLPITGYDENEIYRTISQLGWIKPNDVDPNSTNCRLNAFGIIKHKEHYQFHPYDFEMSQLVRLGSLSRDAALKKLEDPDGKAERVAKVIAAELAESHPRKDGE